MTGSDKQKRRHPLPKPRTIALPKETYQPPKAEQEREHDMPGASPKQVRSAFFRPVNVRRKRPRLTGRM